MNLIFESEALHYRPPRHAAPLHLLWESEALHYRPPRHAAPLHLLSEHNSLHRDAFHGGHGYFAGQDAGIVSVAGRPARREIWLLSLSQNRIIRSQWSDGDGQYFFSHLDPQQEYMIIARDYRREYAPFAWDYRRPAVEMSITEQMQLLRARGIVVNEHDFKP